MSSLLKKGFRASKCKTVLKLTVTRIKLLRNKRDIVAKQTRRDVAQLLKIGQESSARIRVEHVFREENILAAYDLIEQFCELVVNRLPIIESQKQCPPDLKEAVASLMYAAPRCADLQELQKVRDLLTTKYGKEFAVAAAELRPDCGVNRQIIQKLSSHAPNAETKLKLMREIAAENNIEWDFEKSVTESFKLPEDLLEGPKHFVSASQVSIPELSTDTRRDTPRPSADNPAFPTDSKRDTRSQLSVTSETIPSATAPVHASPSSPSSSSSDGDDEVPSVKGKYPPPGKYDSFPRNAQVFTKLGEDPRTQPKAEHGRRPQEGSQVDPYARAKAEGRMDYNNTSDPWTRAKADHGTEVSEVDPYVRAKAEGRMEYRNISDSRTQPKEERPQEASRENAEQRTDFRNVSDPRMQLKADHGTRLQEVNEVDPYARAKAEGRMNYKNTSDPYLRVKAEEGVHYEQNTIAQGTFEAYSDSPKNPSSRKLSESGSIARRGSRPEYTDVATAARAAFESAAHAAKAARAAVSLAGGSSNRRMSESHSSESEEELSTRRSSNLEKAAQTTENAPRWMDSKQSFDSSDHGGKFSESDDDVSDENLSRNRASKHSTLYQRSSQSSRANPSTNVMDDALQRNSGFFNEPERTSSPMGKQKKTSRETGFLERKSNEQIDSYGLEKNAQTTSNAPEWVASGRLVDSNDHGRKSSESEDEASYEDISANRASKYSMQTQRSSQSARANSSTHAANDAVKRNSEFYDQPVELSSLGRKHKNSSSETGFLKTKSNEETGSYGFGKPRFDDDDGEEADDVQAPFYTRGRAAVGREKYEQLRLNEPNLFSVFSKLEEPSPFTQGGSDTGEDLGSGKKLRSKTKSNNRESVQKEHAFKDQAYPGKPHFDDYAEPEELSNKIFFRASPKSPFRSYHHTQETPDDHWYEGDASHTAARGKASVSNVVANKESFQKPDGANHRKLRWHSSTSEELDFPSQSDELSPESDSVYSVKRESHNEEEGRGYNRGWIHGTQAHPREDLAETYPSHGGDGSQTLKGKSFYGQSRRSVRSVRPQQGKELPSPILRHESTDNTLPSILEAAAEEKNFRVRRQRVFPPTESPVGIPPSPDVDEFGKDSRHASRVSKSAPVSSNPDSLLYSSSLSKPPPTISSTIQTSVRQNLASNHFPREAGAEPKLSQSEYSKHSSAAENDTESDLPDCDEFTARIEALRKKR